MALIVFASAFGSPGVTTTALALTLTWPRPVLLVEADPTGASGVYAGFFRGTQEPVGGLIDLALETRGGGHGADSLPAVIADALPRVSVRLSDTGALFLPGIRSHAQASSTASLWEPLTQALRELDAIGQDVLVDAGRLGLAGFCTPLLHGADLALVVTGSSLPALAGAQSWAATLVEAFADTASESRLGLVVVEETDRWPVPAHQPRPRVRAYSGRQVARALKLPLVGRLPWQPEVAEVFSHGATPPRKFTTSALAGAYQATADSILGAISQNRAFLSHGDGDARADARGSAGPSGKRVRVHEAGLVDLSEPASRRAHQSYGPVTSAPVAGSRDPAR